MATLTLTYNTGNVPLSEIMDDFAAAYGYQPIVNGQPNPETKAEHARRRVGEYIQGIVKGQRERRALALVADTMQEIVLT